LTCIGTWYAAPPNLDGGLAVLEGPIEDLDRLHVGDLLGHDVHGVVEDVLRDALLPVVHQAIDELADEERPIAGVGTELFAAGGDLSHDSCFCLTLLGTIETAGLLAALHAERVESTADDVVTNAGKIADTTTTDEHDRVLLEVVPFARDVNRDFLGVGKSHAGDFPERRVGLLGGHRADLKTHATLLRAAVKHGRLGELALRPTAAANKLADRGHTGSLTEGAGIALVNAFGIPRGGNPKM
jgi:hypothetical protein